MFREAQQKSCSVFFQFKVFQYSSVLNHRTKIHIRKISDSIDFYRRKSQKFQLFTRFNKTKLIKKCCCLFVSNAAGFYFQIQINNFTHFSLYCINYFLTIFLSVIKIVIIAVTKTVTYKKSCFRIQSVGCGGEQKTEGASVNC